MTTFRCRTKVPQVSAWKEVEAETPEEAGNEFWFANDTILEGVKWRSEAPVVLFNFALIEVEGHGEWVARTITSKIWRKGGVRNPRVVTTIEHVAAQLGWTHDPKELIGTGWEGEDEDWDQEVTFKTEMRQ